MNPVPSDSLGPLLEALQRSGRSLDLSKIQRAYEFATRAHASQKRASGEPYVTHAVSVAVILAELLGAGADETLLQASLLHDVVEDTPETLASVQRAFGPEVASLVDGVTKISSLHFERPEQEEAENFRKMLFSMAKDLRVILIKLADRLHNMRTLGALGPARAHKVARETREIYAPLAHRLGIARIKWELEDLCLKHLDSVAYQEIKEKVSLKREERERVLQDVIRPVREKLVAAGIKPDVVGRPKHLESIYRKMKAQSRRFEEIYDLLGVRVLLYEKAECYRALGIIHDLFTPVHERFKDYIATPKTNMYQSLHTTVVAPGGLMVEFQIRTHEMHRIAELGVAAHYRYKEGGTGSDSELFGKLAPGLRTFDWQSSAADPDEFLEFLKTSLYQDEVFVFTPRGELRRLPRGATPLDFAYQVHTEVGNHCVGAKVNSRIVPLRYELRSGDKVQIITSPMGKPTRDWLQIVTSPGARSKIRHWLKISEHEDSVTLGRRCSSGSSAVAVSRRPNRRASRSSPIPSDTRTRTGSTRRSARGLFRWRRCSRSGSPRGSVRSSASRKRRSRRSARSPDAPGRVCASRASTI
jgi:GTP pyrophosphokinase